MASSPTCSSVSPSASAAVHETDALSDDSGVDVKPQGVHAPQRKNKRKSSEPKKRKDVLLMKRFRWESDEDEEEPLDEANERPSSGDSGVQVDVEPLAKRPSKQWRKPKPKKEAEEPTETAAPARQSVIIETPRGSESPRQSRPRNYKSMSRQRRIEANARERTRVHTISAAFESLRRAVPAYAHNQKLSKLAILRIASAYIVALACLSGRSGEEDAAASTSSQQQQPPSLADCVERCTRTIQAEGRSRRRTGKE